MIKQSTILINQLLAQVHFDSKDKSVVRISFDNVIKILIDNDILIPQKAYEETLNKVLSEQLVGKIGANESAKLILANAMLEVALAMAVSKEDLIKHKIRTNQA